VNQDWRMEKSESGPFNEKSELDDLNASSEFPPVSQVDGFGDKHHNTNFFPGQSAISDSERLKEYEIQLDEQRRLNLDLHVQLRQLNMQHETLLVEKDECSSALLKQSTQVETLSHQNNVLEKQIRKTQAECEEKNRALQTLNSDLEATLEQLEKSKQFLNASQISTLEDVRISNNSDSEMLDELLKSLENKLESYNKSIPSHPKRVQQLQAVFNLYVECVQETRTKLQAEATKLLDENKKFKEENTGLSNSLELLRSKFARVKQDNVEMQTEIMYLQDQRNRIQGMNIPANLYVSTTFVDEKVQEDESNAVKIIKLNVSGRTFKTTLWTLTTSSSKFKQWFSTDPPQLTRLSDGSYFLELDPDTFHYILEYFRNLQVCLDDLNKIELKRLLETAHDLEVHSLIDYLTPYVDPPLDFTWIDDECESKGFRQIPGSTITFIVAKQAYWNFNTTFDVPEGYKWSSMSEFATEFNRSKEQIAAVSDGEHVYPAWGVESLGWHKYTKHGLKRLFFVFCDTPLTKTFIPCGKNLITTATHKVWKAFDETEEYCEQRGLNPRHCKITKNGIARGFAGLVCLKHIE